MREIMIPEEDYPVWNGYLYELQQEAPRPKAVICRNPQARIDRPHYFGDECHGAISREDGDTLCQEEGNFLIRESRADKGRYTLVLRILGVVKNFKLYWVDGEHFVGDKRFDNIYDLVEDGLITMYVEEKARDYIENMSKKNTVYSSLNRTKQLLASRQFSADPHQLRMQALDPRSAPNDGSPRYAHNGRDTEEAALPYSHYPHQADDRHTQFHNPAYTKAPMSDEDSITEAMEHQLNTNDMYTSGVSNSTYYDQPQQQDSSIIQSLMNSSSSSQMSPYHLGPPRDNHFGGGGNKKSLTPTSSDERKRTKAKKVATEGAVQNYDYDVNYNKSSGSNSPMQARNHSPMRGHDLRRSPSNSSASDGEGRRYHNSQVAQFQVGPPQPRNQQYSPMRRNNSDNFEPYHFAQHTQTNVAHVRQLSASSGSSLSGNSTSGSSVISNVQAPLQRYREENSTDSMDKMQLDANDNQIPPNGPRKTHPNHSPTPSRPKPSQESHPATNLDELKAIFNKPDQVSDDEMKMTSQDNINRKPRLTRSNTTANVVPRPSSGKAPPKPAPREAHSRQRSEPVELFQNPSHRRTCYQIDDSHPTINEGAIYRQQPPREDFRYQMARRNLEMQQNTEHSMISQLRNTGGPGSCHSSISNVSSVSSSTHNAGHDNEYKHPDSISHVSSEEWMGEDRESSPSPHSTGKRSCSSDDNSTSGVLSRGSRGYPRHNGVASSSEIWQHRHSDDRSARSKASPLTSVSDSRHEHDESNDVISDLPKSPKEHPACRRARSEAALTGLATRTNVTSFSSSLNDAQLTRRKGSDSEISSPTRADSKPRHHSETSSEEGTPRTPLEPRVPSIPVHKPLRRSATTGADCSHKKELERHMANNNGHASPNRSNKKTAQRSNSGPSPRKGKKSPDGVMSPRISHMHHRSTSSPRSEGVPYYDKEHVFKSHTYRGLQWCEYCGNFMWGIIQQGMQCRDCGLNVHKQCSKLVPGDCQPAFKHVKKVFGIDLTALVKLHGTERPIVVDKCIEEIEKRGMESVGIYRVSGFHDVVQELKLSFDRYGDDVDLSQYNDISIVASGLKLYLRELPVPLIPYNLYSRFINSAKLSHGDGKLDAIRTAMVMMPPAHLQTLKHIVHHLTRICAISCNQMNSENLGIVFGPTMLRPPEKEAAQSRYNILNDAQYQKDIVQTMIDNVEFLFGQRPELTTIRETHNL